MPKPCHLNTKKGDILVLQQQKSNIIKVANMQVEFHFRKQEIVKSN